MKILFLAGSLNQGGAEFQLLKCAQLFKTKGNEVKILALTDYDFYKNFVVENQLNYEYLDNNSSRPKRVMQAVQHINNYKPELVIAYLREVALVALVAKLLCWHKFRLVIGERTSLITPNYDRYYFQLCRFAEAVTVNSISKKSYIEDNFCFLKKKLFFTPNILNLEEFDWAKVNTNPEKISRLGYVGRISKEKNLLNLVKGLAIVNKDIKEWSLELYGAVTDKVYYEKLILLIKKLGLEKKIIYRGVTNDVHSVYKEIDALCLLSIFEGFSNVLSEALSSGIPIIASDIEENAFLVEHQVNGFLVDRYEKVDIAEGLFSLMKLDALEIKKMNKRNKQKAFDLFEETNTYQRFMNVVNIKSN